MIYVLTPQQMRIADAAAVKDAGGAQLMRAAGRAVAQIVCGVLDTRRVVAFAGPGNNGGDAFAACAQLLETRDDATCVIYAQPVQSASEAREDAESRARAVGVCVRAFPQDYDEAVKALQGATCVLDALFGTGARLPVPEPYASAITAMNAGGAPVLAVDIPSGIDALSGAAERAVRATVTVTLGALKPGLLLDPARDRVGALYLADIGIPVAILQQQQAEFAALDEPAFLDLLPVRGSGADKRGAGAPLIIAGSRQFPGAAVLCARAAARAGAGYVTVAAPQTCAPQLRAHLIEQVVTEISDDAPVERVVEQLLETAGHCSSVGIGPGLGLDARTGEIVRGFLGKTTLPFVADASALFHLAKHLDLLASDRAVITPHAGEFARLSGKGTVAQGERVARLREFVDRTHWVTLLKGRTTLVYDGHTMHLNTTGTSALATAGTGDVLTGMIATLLSQGLSPVDAARAGAHWHGLAGEYCARDRSRGVMAGDLPDVLAYALQTTFDADEYLKLVFGA